MRDLQLAQIRALRRPFTGIVLLKTDMDIEKEKID